MVSDGPVSRWNGVDYAAGDERALQSVLLMRSGSGAFAARSGRRPGGADATVSGLTVTVPADAGVIYDASLGGGPWLWALPIPKPMTLDARPAAGTSRRDLIVARIYDVPGDRRELAIETIKGDPGPEPSPKPIPDLSTLLFDITVPSSGALNIVASKTRTVAAGGILPVSTTSERNALPSPHVGLAVWNEQTGALEIYAGGGAWRRHVVGDASWTDMVVGAAYTAGNAFNSYNPASRLVDGEVTLSGGVRINNGNLAIDNVPVRLVEAHRPIRRIFLDAVGSGTARVRLRIEPADHPDDAGRVMLHANPSSATSWVNFDGLTFRKS